MEKLSTLQERKPRTKEEIMRQIWERNQKNRDKSLSEFVQFRMESGIEGRR
jgi:hypothetical protein